MCPRFLPRAGRRSRAAVAGLLLLVAAPRHGDAQSPAGPAAHADSATSATSATSTRRGDAGYWRSFALGVASSLLLHEAGHVGMSLALGAHPSFAFDKGRPTIFSGISSHTEPHKQFLFSSAGLTAQALADETILDVPHHRGGAVERGVLAGGIGTALFYVTFGRSGSVSDVDFMARTSSLSKAQVSLIVGGVAALHGVRVARDGRYAHFFARPAAEGGMRVGVRVSGER